MRNTSLINLMRGYISCERNHRPCGLAHLRPCALLRKVGPKPPACGLSTTPRGTPDLYIEGSQCVMYMFDLDLNTC